MNTTTQSQLLTQLGTLITILSPLALAIFAAYKAKLKEYVETKISSIKDDNLRKVAQDALDRVDTIATNVITNIDVTMKPAILAQIAKGTMTKADLLGLKQTAKDSILKQLSDDSKTALSSTVGDVDTYLDTLVESTLAKLKIDSTSPVSKTVIPDTSTSIDTDVSTVQAENETLKAQLAAVQSALGVSNSSDSTSTNGQASVSDDNSNTVQQAQA